MEKNSNPHIYRIIAAKMVRITTMTAPNGIKGRRRINLVIKIRKAARTRRF